ncbi:MAG TPA: thermonuclease family protein [Nannocystis sp.]|jgi:micrococcal nuclease
MSVTPRCAILLSLVACAPDAQTSTDPISLCGPSKATVASVIDGDTIVLDTGEKVRYLMIDTPEITSGKHDCYGEEARDYNEELVLGQEVSLTYDVECSDRYGRLLAYVEAPDGEMNTLLLERGFACLLVLPPNGAERESEFATLALEARQSGEGMWTACEGAVACD